MRQPKVQATLCADQQRDTHLWNLRRGTQASRENPSAGREVAVSGIYPLDQLRGFGGDCSNYEGCAVYFLWHWAKLVYIGQTRYLPDRAYHHLAHGRMGVTSVSWCEVDPRDADAVERDYILAYRPPFNQLAGGNITTKGRQWIR